MNYKQQAIKELATAIKSQGFRVFIAKNGGYGFYTDQDGTKVISFQYNLGGYSCSGNYKTNQPTQTGTGWGISNDFTSYHAKDAFDQTPPEWALGKAEWQYTTLDQHLGQYQKSSGYTEL